MVHPMSVAEPSCRPPVRLDTDAPYPLLLDFLRWLTFQPRTYADTLDAWHTSCPRLPVWEDAFARGLVAVDRREHVRLRDTVVSVTPAGQALLDEL
jgi:hypothetical protein